MPENMSERMNQWEFDQQSAESKWDLGPRIENQEGDKVKKSLNLLKIDTKLARRERKLAKREQKKTVQ